MSHATIQTYGGTGTENRMTTVFNPLRDVRPRPRSPSPLGGRGNFSSTSTLITHKETYNCEERKRRGNLRV
jgi:hypothetical protein